MNNREIAEKILLQMQADAEDSWNSMMMEFIPQVSSINMSEEINQRIMKLCGQSYVSGWIRGVTNILTGK